MDGSEHYAEAERLLGLPVDPANGDVLARAAIHAQLATAAAVVLSAGVDAGRVRKSWAAMVGGS